MSLTNKLQIYKEKSKHHSKAFEYFSFDKLDAFHNQDILSVIYGKEWYSVLITKNQKAFLHTFSKQQIGETGWYDVEPFAGYAGPVTNTDDKSFIRKALEIYSDICREEKVIAEIVRFNSILGNHVTFQDSSLLNVFPAKEIVVVECHKDKESQIKQFHRRSCFYMIRKYGEQYQFLPFDKTKEWSIFLNFYTSSLDRVGAQKKWYFTSEFFDRVRQSKFFNVYSVRKEGKLCSVVLAVEHLLAANFLLSANSNVFMPGAIELLIYRLVLLMANKGIPFSFMGGGNSSDPDDPLLSFKKKFAKTTYTFYMGKIIHNPEIFRKLCNDAIQTNPEIEKSNFFLKYRLVK